MRRSKPMLDRYANVFQNLHGEQFRGAVWFHSRKQADDYWWMTRKALHRVQLRRIAVIRCRERNLPDLSVDRSHEFDQTIEERNH